MRQIIAKWVQVQAGRRELLSDGGVDQFARRICFRATMMANAAVVLIHMVLDHFGLLPYPLWQALLIGMSVATVITLGVGFLIVQNIAYALRDLHISRDVFEKLSTTDALSGLMNRRSFFEVFEASTTATGFVIFDIDRFKSINDTFGHAFGDTVIAGVGSVLTEVFAGKALAVARLGGEEFVVLLFDPNDEGRADIVEEARCRIANHAFSPEYPELRFTVSAGMADLDGRDQLEIYKAADRALYVAKASGRNRVIHEHDLAEIAPVIAPALQAAG